MNKINDKLEELIHLLEDQEEIKRFKEIEKSLEKNEHVKNRLDYFRKVQKKITLYEYHENELPEETNKRYNTLLNDLLDIPIFNEYLHLQTDINDLIQQITFIIEEELNDK